MTELQNVLKDFRKVNPKLTRDNMKLAKAHSAKLGDIRIDDTMNRPLDWDHVLNILKNYSATRVLAINVYEDPELPGCLIAWDGQHTLIVLYIIYTMVFEAAASDIDIPVVVSPTNNKAEIRENFIILNTVESKGGGKVDLSPLDLFSQKVFGVRMDGSNKLDWLTAERKQRLLESADLFLTSTAYQNTTDDGAITHVSNIIDEAEPIVEQFCKYWIQRKKYEVRHVETKEIIMLSEFFRACAEDPSVVVDDKFIEDMTKVFWNAFECEFTGQKGLNIFWRKLDSAYQNWYDKVYKEPEIGEEDLRPTRYTLTNNGKWQNTYGVTFMIFLLKKHGFKQTLPKPPTEFKPAKADLW